MKIKYYLKRFGVYGLIQFGLYKKQIILFDPYLYLQHHYYEKLPEKKYEEELGDWYELYNGRNIENIRNPETFNDKIQWLKIHDDLGIRGICSDKLRVREYIKTLNISELNFIPILGTWKSASDIDFQLLPDSFVLKQNAACKLNMIVRDKNKEDLEYIRTVMDKWLEITYGYNGMEIQYLNSPKRIFAEQYMSEINGDLYDYKIFCFNGNPKYIEVIGDRGTDLKHGHSAFFDLDWNLMEFGTKTYPQFPIKPEKPKSLSKMIDIARRLSKPFPFVRVDLYEIGDKIYFGELTFSPTNGIARWYPEDADKILGSMIKLNENPNPPAMLGRME